MTIKIEPRHCHLMAPTCQWAPRRRPDGSAPRVRNLKPTTTNKDNITLPARLLLLVVLAVVVVGEKTCK